MFEVEIAPAPLGRFADVLSPARFTALRDGAADARELLQGVRIWNVNATAQGGGVAEMLQALLGYCLGAGVQARWLVLDADPEFFAITKRLHNFLHGSDGDGGVLGRPEHDHFAAVTADNARALLDVVAPGDLVLLHDPQTAGLVRSLRGAGANVVWRCHIGRDSPTEKSELGWSFLREFAEDADRFVFSRREYAPAWIPHDKLWVIPPSLDPFSTKNAEMGSSDVAAALGQSGLVHTEPGEGSLGFTRRSGRPGTVQPHRDLLVGGSQVPGTARLVLQVSRWDRLKDMTGVLTGFTDCLDDLADDVHLMLAGPDVAGVSDDPEGAEVLAECAALWQALPDSARARVHLCCLPMDDIDENAHLVNALQRHATVVVQKSLVEGFGLTVTEPMWKARPVVASAVGGIQDQVEHGVSGVLLDDPTDLAAYMRAVSVMLEKPERASAMGLAARERVREQFLGDRHLLQYVALFSTLLDGEQ
jgi:trehalose synthase